MVSRVRLPRTVFQKLQILKGRTGLTPNLLCRIALLCSLSDGVPALPEITETGNNSADGVEMNLVTLFGEWEPVFEAVIRQWCFEQGHDVDSLGWVGWALIHIRRGVDIIYPRLKEPIDILVLISSKVGDQPP